MWREFFAYTVNFSGADALVAASQRDPVSAVYVPLSVRIHEDSDYEIVKINYVATDDRVFVRLVDNTSGRRLHRGVPVLSLIAGRSQIVTAFALGDVQLNSPAFNAHILPTPYIIAAGAELIVEAADFSNATNTVRITFLGNKIRPGRAPYDKDRTIGEQEYKYRQYFSWPFESGAIVANGTQPGTIVVDRDADILIRKLMAFRTGVCTVELADAGARDRMWQDRPIHIDNYFGNGSFPNILPSPRFLSRGVGISVSIADLSAAANRVSLLLEGEKLFVAPPTG